MKTLQKTTGMMAGVLLTVFSASAESTLPQAISILEGTPTGKAALEKSRALKIPIVEGSISKTEITATRTLNHDTEKLNFTTQVLVAAEKGPVFQALDLAHELVHAVQPHKRSPFDPNLRAQEYIKNGIESEGGEANAIAQECKVGKELIDTTKIHEEVVQTIKARCQFVWKMESNPSLWTQSFYYMGQYYRDFLSRVDGVKVEPRSPLFSSAVAHKPYPLALLEEYIQITRSICQRAKTSDLARKIASVSGGSLDARCSAIQP